MKGNSLINDDIRQEINSEQPNLDRIKNLVVQAYNEENREGISLKNIKYDEEERIIRWLNQCISNPNPLITSLFLKRVEVKIPFFSQSLSAKISYLSQYHCPICKAENQFPIKMIPIRISAISKQAMISKSKYRKAFEKAIASKFEKEKMDFIKGEKLCILVLFVMSKTNRNKDLDNMSKALMDALEGNLFEADMDIEHLNLLKIRHDGEEDYIKINIRKTDINKHEDVLFKRMAHSWAGANFLDLKDFI